MSYGSIKDLLAKSRVPATPKKDAKPLVMNGVTIPENYQASAHSSPGDQVSPGVIIPDPSDPFRGKKCSIRNCREGAQYKHGGEPRMSQAQAFEQPQLTADDPLVARIEAARQSVRAGQLLETTPEVWLCLKHYYELKAAAAEEVANAQKAAEPESWPMHELDFNGASIEFLDDQYFVLVDGHNPPRRQKFEYYRMKEVQARLAGKTYVQVPVAREDINPTISGIPNQGWPGIH
jgi:hypothetical protein